jgi:ankyrin repeat protein
MKFIKTFEDRYSDIFFNSDISIFEACRRGDLEVVKEYIEVEKIDINIIENNNYTPLILAADNNRIDVVEYLIEKGADINYQDIYDRTALQYATLRENINIVKVLIESNANWNLKDNLGNDFLTYLQLNDKKKIIDEYPKQYQKYLMIKKAEKFNI